MFSASNLSMSVGKMFIDVSGNVLLVSSFPAAQTNICSSRIPWGDENCCFSLILCFFVGQDENCCYSPTFLVFLVPGWDSIGVE